MNNGKMIAGVRVGNSAPVFNRRVVKQEEQEVSGVLDLARDGRGMLRVNLKPCDDDVVVGSIIVRNNSLRAGDMVVGVAQRPGGHQNGYWNLAKVEKINGVLPGKLGNRPRFDKGVPVFPNERITLEVDKGVLSNRLIDLMCPIGKGQRGLIVSPPKAGKTTILKEIATGVAKNHPDIHLMAVLVGERPEEVTDITRHIEKVTKDSKMLGETLASNFDEKAEDQTRVAEIALERAKRLVEQGKDVVILLDSVTRLARAYNLAMPTSGRTLSGGFDPAALYPPKRFFGAARNFEEKGSLTIIGTALVDTGSRMDDLVYEEFKGTGNMELVLDRKLAERRIYPAIDILKSSTRRDDLLFSNSEYQSVVLMRNMMSQLNDREQALNLVLDRLKKTKTNKEFLASLKEG
ncbi:transcription termination factor Rho [Patescibacteria group bacterium]|nr:transcription termination factor Rho [Patescibacteria group bacterium]